MPSTYTSLHCHLVFGTSKRQPLIRPDWKEDLHAYLGGTVKGLKAFPEGVGGMPDHVHLLVGLRSTHRLSDFIRDLKTSSCVWVKEEIGIRNFKWQEGYAAFSVSPTARHAVRNYIRKQEEHHRVKSFREEILEFLEVAEVTFDPKYFDY